MEINHAYTAGIMDGEGTITLSKLSSTSKFRSPVITVSSTTHCLLTFLQENYGGTICTHKIYQQHHKPSWSWMLRYNNTITFLENVLPYMREPNKVYRGDLIVNQYKSVTPRNGKYTDEMLLAKTKFEYDFFHPSDTLDKP
jgi:hypothetical protein